MATMDAIFHRLSKNGKPEFDIEVGGELHESAIGTINFAQYKDSRKNVNDSMILKSIDLNEQNMYCVTIDNKRSTIRGLDKSKILFMSASKRECKEWVEVWCSSEVHKKERGNAMVCKIVWLTDIMQQPRDSANKLVLFNEYMNEAVVGKLVTLQVKLPHIIATRDVWISDATGYILQDYGGTSLQKSMVNLTLPQFQSIVLQVLVTLAICQHTSSLKHHDMHLGNIFLNFLTSASMYDGQLLQDDKTYWHYNIACLGNNAQINKTGLNIYIPHNNVLAKIGDFGLASATHLQSQTRFERVDYPMLDACELEWGEWSGRLDTMKSYDAVTFLAQFFLKDECSLCPKQLSSWARSLYHDIQAYAGPRKIECSFIGRPMRNQEGNISIARLLQLPCFAQWQEKPEGATFRTMYDYSYII